MLPLQVTTVIYRLHSNAPLGPQRNIVVRGVPAIVYDEGHSIELYTGREAIDVFSDSLAHALAAAQQLQPVNAPGSAARLAPGAGLLPRPLRTGQGACRRRDGLAAEQRLPQPADERSLTRLPAHCSDRRPADLAPQAQERHRAGQRRHPQ